MLTRRVSQKRTKALEIGHLLNAQLSHLESCLVDTRRLGSSAENVHFIGQVVRRDDPRRFLKETVARSVTSRDTVPWWVAYYSAESIR